MFKKEILFQLAELASDHDVIFDRLEELTKAVKKLEKAKSKEK